jgi:nitrogen regulatory protein P-II 1
VEFVPKVKIEIALPDELVDQVIDAILKSAKTGKFGDGKVFVTPLEQVVRVRTGEYNERAL